EDLPRHTSEYELTQPRMAVAAQDQEICRAVSGVRQNRIGDVGFGRDDQIELHLGAVARKVLSNVSARHFVAFGAVASHDHDFNQLSAPNEGHSVAGSARCAGAAITGQSAEIYVETRSLNVGDDQHGPAGIEESRLDHEPVEG